MDLAFDRWSYEQYQKNKTFFATSFFKIFISFYFFCILGYMSLSSHFLFEFYGHVFIF